jgi:hypothetical protein
VRRICPRTLQEAILYFPNTENCEQFVIELRSPTGAALCPHCGSDHVTYLEGARVWKCYTRHDRPRFSLKTGTIFEDSPIGLEKWLTAVWLIVNCNDRCRSAATLNSFVNFRRDDPMTQILHSMNFEP